MLIVILALVITYADIQPKPEPYMNIVIDESTLINNQKDVKITLSFNRS
jgi:hypothetical protein